MTTTILAISTGETVAPVSRARRITNSIAQLLG